MKDPYSVLGVDRNASDDEIQSAYHDLARKYHPDNYGDDNPLKDLAKEKMQEVNEAYDTIRRERENASKFGSNNSSYYSSSSQSSYGIYADIRRCLNARRFGEARKLIRSVEVDDRTAEWHYLCSVVLMHEGRANDAMRELEIACEMDPVNMEYQKAKEMFNRGGAYGSTYYDTGRPQHVITDSDVCNCCTNLICADCLCECLGGDLIPCI